MSTASLRAVVRYVHRIAEQGPGGLNDRQLLDRFTLQEDESAFAELVRRHGPMVLATCRHVLRQEQDTEDAFQAAFLILAKKAGSIRHESVGGWLYQVARRVALRARALAALRRERFTTIEDGLTLPSAQQPSDVLAWLHEELERLPEPYRSAVVLCYLEGRTQAEAARMLATTAGAVNSRLKRARDLLRQRLHRSGLALSSVAVAEALRAGAARAALSGVLIQNTARTALLFATGRAPAWGASALAVALANGALQGMITLKIKTLLALVLVTTLLAASALFLSPPALGEDTAAPAVEAPAAPPRPVVAARPPAKPPAKGKPQLSCIVLWMGGGPSQIDTFDPKPAHANGALFDAIDTNVKGVQISENLPLLAKQMNHLAIIRSLTHREGDHARGTHLMRTGHEVDGLADYPALPCVLAKELGDARPGLPRYIRIGQRGPLEGVGHGPGFLGAPYASLDVSVAGGDLRLPPVAAFEKLTKGRGEAQRKAVAKAFDLGEEKDALRDAYGRTVFGQGCLLARRLVERGVPVVEVPLGGWDMHADALVAMPKLSAQLDAAWSALLKDLHARKRLDTTLVVWMGEFGRTPRVNPSLGRDHYPLAFSVVLAGGGIKGGQVIGKTSADGVRVEARPVTPQELHATIYTALGIDPAKENRTPTGRKVRLVERGTKPVKEALR